MTTTANLVVGLPYKMMPREHQSHKNLLEQFEEFYCCSRENMCPTEIVYGWCVAEAMESYLFINGYDIVRDIEIKRAEFFNLIGKQAQIILIPDNQED